MKHLMLGAAAVIMVAGGPAASANQAERRQNAVVEVSVTGADGRTLQMGDLSQADRQRVVSLRNSLQQWGNQQSQRVSITIRCSYPPLRCEITVRF